MRKVRLGMFCEGSGFRTIPHFVRREALELERLAYQCLSETLGLFVVTMVT